MIRSCHYCLVYLDIIDIVINIICRSCDGSMPGPDTGHTADTGTMWVAVPAGPACCLRNCCPATTTRVVQLIYSGI